MVSFMTESSVWCANSLESWEPWASARCVLTRAELLWLLTMIADLRCWMIWRVVIIVRRKRDRARKEKGNLKYTHDLSETECQNVRYISVDICKTMLSRQQTAKLFQKAVCFPGSWASKGWECETWSLLMRGEPALYIYPIATNATSTKAMIATTSC